MSAVIASAKATGVDRRAEFIKWLRKMHGWVGLWGAILGLLFGFTGVLQNHRAVLKIPASQVEENSQQLKITGAAPASARDMAALVQRELHLDKPASRVREEPARPTPWDKGIIQPARFTANFASASHSVQAEYWAGADHVNVRTTDANVFATLGNLHKGIGAGVGWVLLADTLGGGMIFLAITGVLLWTQLNRRRMLGSVIAAFSLFASAYLASQML